MKYVIRLSLQIIIVFILACNQSYSQEQSSYKCVYRFNMLKDTLANEYAREELYVVQIGNKITKGFTYQKFYLDSLQKANPALYQKMFNESVEASVMMMRKTGDVKHMKENAFTYGAFTSELYKDYSKNEIFVKDNIVDFSFVYKDELVPQKWEILQDTATILGYDCQKAICSYRGRNYEAWFTTEIPISEGPWKFYGLPGLITKLHDTKSHYTFELIGFQKIDEPITTKIGSGVRKIDRKKFYQMLFGDKSNELSQALMNEIGLKSSDTQKREYEPIELDYK